jgi:hypothetical protein
MRSLSVKPGEGLAVMAACFGERPERAWLAELAANDSALSLIFVESRFALIRRARSLRPRVVLLPLRDAAGLPSAPLIARLRAKSPDFRVMLLLAPETSRVGLAEAIRAGGEVVVLGGMTELRAILLLTNRSEEPSAREHDAARALLGGLHSADLREILVFCVMRAHQRLSVGDVAMLRGLSVRALGRQARDARWPAPSELIGWGCLLRASLLQWRESSSRAVLANASGFSSARALQRTAERLLQRPVDDPRDLAPLLVSSRLQRRVQWLERPEPH